MSLKSAAWLGAIAAVLAMPICAVCETVPAYTIGAIPPLTARQGQTLRVTVDAPSAGLPIEVTYGQAPEGSATLNSATGLFSYRPAASRSL